MSQTVQLPLDLRHRPAMGWEDFLVAPSNADAVAWLDCWPAWPAPALTVFGPEGSGKTHIAHVWRARSNAPIARADSLASADLPALLAPANALVIEGAGQVAGNAACEQALFHLYNIARDCGGHLLLLATEPPARWATNLPDLDSRLRASPVVEMQAPDDALLAAVLVKLFADRQLRPGQEVIGYLLTRMERSMAAARKLVAAIDRASLAAHRPLTVPLAREVLAELEDQPR